jgi:hypothetical protein
MPTDSPARAARIVSSLNQTREYIHRAVDGIDHSVLWSRPSPGISSIGNILMHLRGTEHQWIGVKIGGMPLDRNRPLEFSTQDGKQLSELLEDLERTRAETDRVLAGLTDVSAEALFCLHYTENHFAFHAGQLCILRKLHEPDFALY